MKKRYGVACFGLGILACSLYKKFKSSGQEYRIGSDIVDMNRNVDIEKLAYTILSEDELYLFRELSEKRQREFLFGHLAAKEAFLKACGKGLSSLSLKDINISYLESGKPVLNFDGCDVSISHDANYAIANVIVSNKKLLNV